MNLAPKSCHQKFLKTLRDALKNSVGTLLNDQNISFDDIHAFAAPRRLALTITGVGEFQPDRIETKKAQVLRQRLMTQVI